LERDPEVGLARPDQEVVAAPPAPPAVVPALDAVVGLEVLLLELPQAVAATTAVIARIPNRMALLLRLPTFTTILRPPVAPALEARPSMPALRTLTVLPA
jgi:hypothetical protein